MVYYSSLNKTKETHDNIGKINEIEKKFYNCGGLNILIRHE